MPTVSEIDIYRRLVQAQRPGPATPIPATAPEVGAATPRDDNDRPDLVHVAATMTSAGPGLSVVVVVFQLATWPAGPYRFEPSTRRLTAIRAGDRGAVLRRRHPTASAALIVTGDVEGACADAGLPGYGQLLVRAGAAVEAGSAAAAAAGFVTRIMHTTDSAVNRALPGSQTPLSSIALLWPRPADGTADD